ncbi:hypothetical protein K491DRAFT_696178 [Lophiostoma macrostomum CBS 122681]|uniref:Uncharacterized protein n=1 Tax=Lophiostoma macrostomum CBS 122681 TaxID=1314788 RepID=A0A6A6SVK7_9PLEO|nr:hypothetical protein K491DRAFT_696178 [Lophiostoma macrostomum CBS 122681]
MFVHGAQQQLKHIFMIHLYLMTPSSIYVSYLTHASRATFASSVSKANRIPPTLYLDQAHELQPYASSPERSDLDPDSSPLTLRSRSSLLVTLVVCWMLDGMLDGSC